MLHWWYPSCFPKMSLEGTVVNMHDMGWHLKNRGRVRGRDDSTFATSYVMVFFMFNESRRDVIVRFVDIGDHHCLRFVFIKHLHTLQPAIWTTDAIGNSDHI